MPTTSTYYEDLLLAYTSSSPTYLSLHTANPGQTGANEETGGGYARVAVSWAGPSGGSMVNAGGLTVTNNGTATYIGLWDAASGGNFLIGGVLTPSQSGSTVTIAAGGVTLAATN